MDAPSSTCRNHPNRPAVDAVSGLCEECARTPEQPTTFGRTAPPPEPQVLGSETRSVLPSDVDIRASDILPDVLRDTADRDHSEAEEQLATRDYEPAAFTPITPEGYTRYRVLSVGGMGSVFAATQDGQGNLGAARVVAIKFGTQRPYRMAIEAVVQGSLSHPNILGVITWGETNTPYVVMEYASGGSLLDLISPKNPNGKRERRPLPPDVAARWMERVCAATHAAHTHPKKIIHRDIKPGNIVLTRDGDADVPADPDTLWVKTSPWEVPDSSLFHLYVPRLADFGLAKRLEVKDGATIDTIALGTPSYMPPEQWDTPGGGADPEDEGPAVDARADVYAIGATLHHLLCGEPPFRGELHELRQKSLYEEPPPLRSVKLDVPRELEAIVWKCLKKMPEERYQSAEDVRRELERYLDDPATVEAPRLGWWWRRWRNVRRNRGAIAACALAVAVFTAGAAIPWRPNGPQQTPEVTAHKRDPEPPPLPLPPDEALEAIRAELRDKGRVVIVGPTGLPRWHRWRLAPAVLGPSPVGDKVCWFQTGVVSLLDLIPDLGIDRYRVSIELRQERGGQIPAAGETVPDRVGFYFGAADGTAGKDYLYHALFLTWFQDAPTKALVPGGTPPPCVVRFSNSLLVQRPAVNRMPSEHIGDGGGAIDFKPLKTRPGKWRKVVVEVSPERVLVQWRKDDGVLESFIAPPAPIRHWTGNEIRKMRSDMQPHLNDACNGAGGMIPGWSPRQAMGLFVAEGAVSFRNVELEILPAPSP